MRLIVNFQKFLLLFLAVSGFTSVAAFATEYRNYNAYTTYKADSVYCHNNPNSGQCGGTESFCQANYNSSSCGGTLVFCEHNYNSSACQGTKLYCDNNYNSSACAGTKIYCEHNYNSSACAGTPVYCQNNPNSTSCTSLPYDPCRNDYYSQACLNKRCQTTYSQECKSIYCRYHPEDSRCNSNTGTPDPEVDRYCRSHGYVPRNGFDMSIFDQE